MNVSITMILQVNSIFLHTYIDVAVTIPLNNFTLNENHTVGQQICATLSSKEPTAKSVSITYATEHGTGALNNETEGSRGPKGPGL